MQEGRTTGGGGCGKVELGERGKGGLRRGAMTKQRQCGGGGEGREGAF